MLRTVGTVLLSVLVVALALPLPSKAQAIAQGATLTMTPDARYGSTCFCPASIIFVTRTAPFFFGPYTPNIKDRLQVRDNFNRPLRAIQLARDHAMFALNVASTDGITSITLTVIGFFTETVSLAGPSTPVAAAPFMRAEGVQTSLQDPVGQIIQNGEIVFGPRVGLIYIALTGGGFGLTTEWVCRIVGEDVDIEMPARSFPLQPVIFPRQLSELVEIGVPRLDPGLYTFQLFAQENRAIASNALTLRARN